MRAEGTWAEVVEDRIREDMNAFGGQLPRRSAIAWKAWVNGLFDWGVLSPEEHARVIEMLPHVEEPDPTLGISVKPSQGEGGRPCAQPEPFEQILRRETETAAGHLPEERALAWRAYLAGLLEWDIMSIPAYDRAIALLPRSQGPEIQVIFLGRGNK